MLCLPGKEDATGAPTAAPVAAQLAMHAVANRLKASRPVTTAARMPAQCSGYHSIVNQ
jgi:hypothetical protein